MLHDQDIDCLDSLAMMRELINSIRDVSKRIDELTMIVNRDICRQEKKAFVVDRIRRLKETKIQLIYSVYDTRTRFINAVDISNGEKLSEIEKRFPIEKLYLLAKHT